MKPIHDMGFAEFAEAVRPSAGMNRWPQVGAASDVVSYSVYMNGEAARLLPETVREHEFRDVTLHALTEKLGLDPLSMRDNIKVAEVLAMRHAYMTSVLEASITSTLSESVLKDYELLTNQMSHPLILETIEQQKGLGAQLRPVLAEAARALGQPVQETAAAGVSRGAVVSQNSEFTVQDLGGGRIVAHENRRLDAVPAVGDDVTVAYYRGKGQVVENIQSLSISEPYVDAATGDLAVKLFDGADHTIAPVKQVVLFNSMAMIAEFAAENGLDRDFIGRAMDARAEKPKRAPVAPLRTVSGQPYIDVDTGLLAVDYMEGPVKYSALFPSLAEFAVHGKALGASEEMIQAAGRIVPLDGGAEQSAVRASSEEANRIAHARGTEVRPASVAAGRYSGTVIATTDFHVVQDEGRGRIAIHDKRQLDKVPYPGEKMTVAYKDGRGEVSVRDASKDRGQGRS